MLAYLYHALEGFQSAFSRQRAAVVSAVVPQFFGRAGNDRGDLDGRFWRLGGARVS